MSDIEDTDIETKVAPAKVVTHQLSSDEIAPQTSQKSDIDGLGKFLFQMHSLHYTALLFAQEETMLQFYEHVVVATITTRLWCFPKACQTIVIPRFKIVDASFTFGPRRIPAIVWLLLLISIVFLIAGGSSGGCSADLSTGSSCGLLVIGCLLLVVFTPAILLAFCFRKRHHLYLDVKSQKRIGSGVGVTTYDFRFKKFAFENAAYNQAVVDEFYLMDYVYGPLGKCGNESMSRYHLLSHFHNVNLANPILPLHGDESFVDLVVSAGNGGTCFHKQKQVNHYSQ
ncbi:hypothetical protein HJC23_013540 [Cyclotella cryptica]|uniref:Uncharacterized protein n=1 Tax=Cyclotella cryptica TaxID=29204 RepID=A0ABD3NHV8_9STRA